MRCVVSHHGWPCPTGPTFAAGWLAEVWLGRAAVDVMRADELMPDILWVYVETLASPAPREWAAAAATVTAEGLVDRARLVPHLFSALTGPDAPGPSAPCLTWSPHSRSGPTR